MISNEEMQDDALDVEGHGFKEVAIGLTAAGVVVTGASAAMAMSNPAPGTSNGVHAVVGGVQDDTTGRTDWIARTTLAPSAQVNDKATDAIGAASVGTPQTPTTSRRIGGVEPVVSEATGDPMGWSDRQSDHWVSDARDVRDSTISGATQFAADTNTTARQTAASAGETLDATQATAGQTADGTKATAGQKVDSTRTTAGQTVDSTQGTVSQVSPKASADLKGRHATAQAGGATVTADVG